MGKRRTSNVERRKSEVKGRSYRRVDIIRGTTMSSVGRRFEEEETEGTESKIKRQGTVAFLTPDIFVRATTDPASVAQ